jgi:hypothetical protein
MNSDGDHGAVALQRGDRVDRREVRSHRTGKAGAPPGAVSPFPAYEPLNEPTLIALRVASSAGAVAPLVIPQERTRCRDWRRWARS